MMDLARDRIDRWATPTVFVAGFVVATALGMIAWAVALALAAIPALQSAHHALAYWSPLLAGGAVLGFVMVGGLGLRVLRQPAGIPAVTPSPPAATPVPAAAPAEVAPDSAVPSWPSADDILHKTIHFMVDAVIVADWRGHVLIANPAAHELFGSLPGADAGVCRTGLRFADGVTPLPEAALVQRVLAGEEVIDVEFVHGAEVLSQARHIVANGRPLRDAQGALIGAVVVCRDVTRLRETERQLHQAQKMEAVGQLTGGIAHDFNNILTVILGTIEILTEGVADRPHLVVISRMIDEAAGRGADLTRQLLAFARRQPLQPQPTDVNDLINSTGKLLRPTLGEQIQMHLVLDSSLAPALVDASQLVNAVVNLALNARDAMPSGGRLLIETGNTYLDRAAIEEGSDLVPGRYVTLTVTDSGIGIPAEIVDRVIEPFFTTKTSGQGSGLGLSMVYGFVKQSRGHLRIDSVPGQGTRICLYLPTTDIAPLPAAEPLPVALTGGSEAILLVEDDQLVRNFAAEQLRALGYAVSTAGNAAEAVALIEGNIDCDLLMTDVVLPGALNGKQLAEEIERRRPAVQIIFTSGYSENVLMADGRLMPGTVLLAKPFRHAEMAQTVRRVLDHAPGAGPARVQFRA